MMRCFIPLAWILVLSSFNPIQGDELAKAEGTVRFATFNCSLNREVAGGLIADLRSTDHPQALKVAEIIQRVRPDVLLLNEFDYDADQVAWKLFQENYLGRSQNGQAPLKFNHIFQAESNTGLDSGLDLNQDGQTGTADDAFGFGKHPGQYGMIVLSNYPIDSTGVRTFQKFLWREMPHPIQPIDPKTSQPYYSDSVRQVFRLSSKSHWDVPIQWGDRTVHFLACHPTPPVFDGPEDRNGARNRDEIRFWADYISGLDYFRDDAGRRGGLNASDLFVVAGDLNADPNDGDSREQPSRQLLNHPRIADSKPASAGGAQQAQLQGLANRQQRGDPALDSADFSDRQVGNLRVDYVLPCRDFEIVGSGVYWPRADSPQFALVDCSDHRLVWVDLR